MTDNTNNKFGIAGHDILLLQNQARLKQLFKDYVPEFSLQGEYNDTPRAATQAAGAQTKWFVHKGPHASINDAIGELLKDIETGTDGLDPELRSNYGDTPNYGANYGDTPLNLRITVTLH